MRIVILMTPGWSEKKMKNNKIINAFKNVLKSLQLKPLIKSLQISHGWFV